MTLAAGFADPVFSAQSVFRAVMDALARPGSVHRIDAIAAPAPLSPTAAAIALTLLDHDTPVWLDAPLASSAEVSDWIRFHTGAPVVQGKAAAAFAIIGQPAELPAFDEFNLGSAEYPDRSATFIVDVETLDSGVPLILTGPGIRGQSGLNPGPLPPDFAARLTANRALFPRGVDLLLAAPGAVAALPRSVMPSGA